MVCLAVNTSRLKKSELIEIFEDLLYEYESLENEYDYWKSEERLSLNRVQALSKYVKNDLVSSLEFYLEKSGVLADDWVQFLSNFQKYHIKDLLSDFKKSQDIKISLYKNPLRDSSNAQVASLKTEIAKLDKIVQNNRDSIEEFASYVEQDLNSVHVVNFSGNFLEVIDWEAKRYGISSKSKFKEEVLKFCKFEMIPYLNKLLKM